MKCRKVLIQRTDTDHVELGHARCLSSYGSRTPVIWMNLRPRPLADDGIPYAHEEGYSEVDLEDTAWQYVPILPAHS